MNSEHFDAVNNASATLNQAKTRSWNAFAGMNDDHILNPPPEILALASHLTEIHEIRAILHANTNAIDEVTPALTNLRKNIFNTISHTIMELNIAVANAANMSHRDVGDIKHDIEGSLLTTAQHLRIMFDVFEIKSPSKDEQIHK